jgi:hypothetical protein
LILLKLRPNILLNMCLPLAGNQSTKRSAVSHTKKNREDLLACEFFTCNEHEDVDIKCEPPGSHKAFPDDGWEASSSGHQCKPFQGVPEMFEQ